MLAAHGEAIGHATNNVAEYSALVAGMAKAVELGVPRAGGRLRLGAAREADAGEYRVKNEALRELSLEAARLARRIGKVTYTAVRREHNELADRLVNEALDAA